ncbi:helix-turn-helix transcriptional regulator [Aeromicrobium sp.]
MPPDLSTTSFALLGLLAFDEVTSTEGLTGYELKQRADRTLRFYWVSPAMSQIYTEVSRLHRHGLVDTVEQKSGRRTTRHYRITAEGRQSLSVWMKTSEIEFPVLKHPFALRLLMGRLMEPADIEALLEGYLNALVDRRKDLLAVRTMLGDDEERKFPAMVADWGLHYYDSETEIVKELKKRL